MFSQEHIQTFVRQECRILIEGDRFWTDQLTRVKYGCPGKELAVWDTSARLQVRLWIAAGRRHTFAALVTEPLALAKAIERWTRTAIHEILTEVKDKIIAEYGRSKDTKLYLLGNNLLEADVDHDVSIAGGLSIEVTFCGAWHNPNGRARRKRRAKA